MLTCFLPPSSGTARVAGRDVMEEPLEARRHVGYMPENNPLYERMRCREYLKFRAELKGVSRRTRNARIEECMDLCGIRPVADRIIGTLSKGYHQRVGLADALLANPDVLILDEPTIGLDPNQMRQTRSTISDLRERHTILLSTHILQEVEAICQRALIIDRGRIVADDTVTNLSENNLEATIETELRADPAAVRQALEGLAGVGQVHVQTEGDWCACTVVPSKDRDIREEIFHLARLREWPLRELTLRRATLEDVFRQVTAADGDIRREPEPPEA
jgi:ABC-2 type transport system ATP-binding protein